MKETTKKALQKTIREVFILSVILATGIFLGRVAFYVYNNLASLIEWLIMMFGIPALIGTIVLVAFSWAFYFRYKLNLFNIEHNISKERLEWLDASAIPDQIPQGRYNIQLVNGAMIWNTTDKDLEKHRTDVKEWMRKSTENEKANEAQVRSEK